jgi:hypothetical protein
MTMSRWNPSTHHLLILIMRSPGIDEAAVLLSLSPCTMACIVLSLYSHNGPQWCVGRVRTVHRTVITTAQAFPFTCHWMDASRSSTLASSSFTSSHWRSFSGSPSTVRTGSGPMPMCCDIFAAARLWRGRLLTTGHLSSSHPVVVGAGDVAWGSQRWGVRKRGRAQGAALPSACGFSAV